MPEVELARTLHRFFPSIQPRITVEGTTVAEVVRALEAVAPGLPDYIVDERGALRPHVNLFVGEEMVVDRRALSDRVAPGAKVYVFQALSGG